MKSKTFKDDITEREFLFSFGRKCLILNLQSKLANHTVYSMFQKYQSFYYVQCFMTTKALFLFLILIIQFYTNQSPLLFFYPFRLFQIEFLTFKVITIIYKIFELQKMYRSTSIKQFQFYDFFSRCLILSPNCNNQ
ncbi:unnamed protein product [Paramecium octaurelia]|uniref:Transmembrane protein n=1 Tax=Paramecium octaurelia TaxID=43137 RepID=A0A8S1SGK7_PAROT|nr:unnamed protein product [Paramecium octaurelia]